MTNRGSRDGGGVTGGGMTGVMEGRRGWEGMTGGVTFGHGRATDKMILTFVLPTGRRMARTMDSRHINHSEFFLYPDMVLRAATTAFGAAHNALMTGSFGAGRHDACCSIRVT